MDNLDQIAKVANMGGSAAIIICAYYIYQCGQAMRLFAERLARIEAKLNIDQPKE